MFNREKTVKIYDTENNLIGKGRLLNLSTGTIKIKGDNLPVLCSQIMIFIEIYDDISGIDRYFCKVKLASHNQLNAYIVEKNLEIERRKSLKVRTDLSFYIESFIRNDKDIIKNHPNMIINMLNLCIGGMLISSNYELNINDIITFSFQYEKLVILLKAKVIRISKTYSQDTKPLPDKNYGCIFEQMPSYYEDIITKYLYKRQIILYKNK